MSEDVRVLRASAPRVCRYCSAVIDDGLAWNEEQLDLFPARDDQLELFDGADLEDSISCGAS